jgi:Erv1 / Alr family
MIKFTKKDYESKDGFNVNIWGKQLWSVLHCISFNYPVEPTAADRTNYNTFILSLQHVLPCKACRDNYSEHLNDMGYGMDKLRNRETFSKFVYDLHNRVNKKLNKPVNLSYREVRDRYEMFRARCLDDTPIIPRQECVVNPSKSVISIVPMNSRTEAFKIDPRCISTKPEPAKKKSRRKSRTSK